MTDRTANIRIASVVLEDVKKGSSKYTKMSVAHTNLDSGKVEVKSLFSFTAKKEVWDVLADSKPGNTFTVGIIKNDKGYLDWVEISNLSDAPVATTAPVAAKPASASAIPAPAFVPAKTNTYEVNNQIQQDRLNFDKAKQTLIIRQSCLSSAVALIAATTVTANVEEILDMAGQFEAWVNGGGVANMTDDIPE